MAQVEVTHQPENSRYVATLDGEQVGTADYEVDGDVITFTHTNVDKAAEGQGIGTALIEASIEDVRRDGRRVVPQCPFYAAWFDKHADAADLLA